MIFNRQLKSYFDKIHPNNIGVRDDVVPSKRFKISETVWCRNYSAGPKWVEGVVVDVNTSVSYSIQLKDSRVIKRHLNQLRKRSSTEWNFETCSDEYGNSTEKLDQNIESAELFQQTPSEYLVPVESDTNTNITPRRSSRNRRPPDFYDPTGC